MTEKEGVGKIREAMSEDLEYVNSDTPVSEIARKLRDGGIGSVIVKDENEVRGIVTNSDLVTDYVVAEKGTKAENIMTKDLITASPDMNMEEAAMIMIEKGVERLVVREGNELIGVISQNDIMKVRPSLYLDITQGLKLGPESVEMDLDEKEVGQCESCENFSEGLEEVNGNLICGFCREEMNFA